MDTHQTCSHKPSRTEAPNLPSKALQQIANLCCQNALPKRRKIQTPPTSSCRVPSQLMWKDREGSDKPLPEGYSSPITQCLRAAVQQPVEDGQPMTREMNPTSCCPPPYDTISSVFEEPACVFRGFQKGSQGSHFKLVSQFLPNLKISTSSLRAAWMNEKCHGVECPRQSASRE